MGFPFPSGNALLYYKDIKASAATVELNISTGYAYGKSEWK